MVNRTCSCRSCTTSTEDCNSWERQKAMSSAVASESIVVSFLVFLLSRFFVQWPWKERMLTFESCFEAQKLIRLWRRLSLEFCKPLPWSLAAKGTEVKFVFAVTQQVGTMARRMSFARRIWQMAAHHCSCNCIAAQILATWSSPLWSTLIGSPNSHSCHLHQQCVEFSHQILCRKPNSLTSWWNFSWKKLLEFTALWKENCFGRRTLVVLKTAWQVLLSEAALAMWLHCVVLLKPKAICTHETDLAFVLCLLSDLEQLT